MKLEKIIKRLVRIDTEYDSPNEVAREIKEIIDDLKEVDTACNITDLARQFVFNARRKDPLAEKDFEALAQALKL